MHTAEWKNNWKMPNIVKGINERGYWVDYPENLKIGKRVDISKFVYLQCRNGIELGDDVEIGPFTALLSESSIDSKSGKIVINEGACIGAHCTIMPNTVVGEYAIVGAHSFVNKDVPPYALVVGSPAIIKKWLDVKGNELE